MELNELQPPTKISSALQGLSLCGADQELCFIFPKRDRVLYLTRAASPRLASPRAEIEAGYCRALSLISLKDLKSPELARIKKGFWFDSDGSHGDLGMAFLHYADHRASEDKPQPRLARCLCGEGTSQGRGIVGRAWAASTRCNGHRSLGQQHVWGEGKVEIQFLNSEMMDSKGRATRRSFYTWNLLGYYQAVCLCLPEPQFLHL